MKEGTKIHGDIDEIREEFFKVSMDMAEEICNRVREGMEKTEIQNTKDGKQVSKEESDNLKEALSAEMAGQVGAMILGKSFYYFDQIDPESNSKEIEDGLFEFVYNIKNGLKEVDEEEGQENATV